MKLQNVKRLVKTFFSDCREFNIDVAFARLYRDLPFFSWDKRRIYYENSILRYLDNNYSKVMEECVKNYDPCKSKPIDKKYIWVMWWQGEDNMPPIVKACYSRLKRISSNYSLVLITQDNWKEYISLPDYIIEKLNSKQFTLTHFSDIVRFELLKEYGGAWIDATVYIEDFPNGFFDEEFFTLHSPGLFPNFIFRGNWSGFFWYFGHDHNVISCCMTDLFSSYWNEHTRLIDYLLIDYFIYIINEKIIDVKKNIDSCIVNNSYYELNLLLNHVFDQETFEKTMNNSPFQKLTYKKEFKKKYVGEKTFYSFLLDREGICDA